MIRQLRQHLDAADSFFKKYSVLGAIFFAATILAATNGIFFKRYYNPTQVFWDEAYHIPAAAKYVAGVHFMEPHPPLGKMFIAWGEMLLNWGEQYNLVKANNGNTYGFEKVEQTSMEMPDGFTFKGYRLFPALAGWFNVLLFAYIIVELTQRRRWVLLFLPLYAFDNALITLFRGAMLDSLMIFGCLLCLWGFLRALNLPVLNTGKGKWALFVMVFGFAFAVMTKVLSLLFILLWPLLVWLKRKNSRDVLFLLKAGFAQVIFFAMFFCAVWFYHIQQGTRLIPGLRFQGMYYGSSDYEKLVVGLPNDIGPVEGFFIRVRDNVRFSTSYEERVPPFDLDRGNITASFPIMWPFGSRPVYFRNTYPFEVEQRHLFMIPNPVTWGVGLIAFLIALGGLLAGFLFSVPIFSQRGTALLSVFCALYVSYMIAVSAIRRMLYLNHYVIPLLLTYFIFVVLIVELWRGAKSPTVKRCVQAFSLAFPLLAFGGFLFMKPFTYYEPITCAEGYERGLFRFWNLKLNFCKDPATNKSFLGKAIQPEKFAPAMIIDEVK